MNCKFIWYSLPQQIKDKIGTNVLWWNLPKVLDKILKEFQQEDPTCYNEIYPEGHKQFLWFNLTAQLTNLCELKACIE